MRCFSVALLIATAGLFVISACESAPAQETVLYTFSENGNKFDGRHPSGLVHFDRAGNLYGVTINGGPFDPTSYCQGYNGCGTIYELTPSATGWTETVLYNFCPSGQDSRFDGCRDGFEPVGGLVSDSAGNLYGTTQFGGGMDQPGVVFELSPPVNGGSWTENVIWNFGSSGDGIKPGSSLTWGAGGKLYGTAEAGGAYNSGVVFALSPESGGGWTETVVHSFGSANDGVEPSGGVVFDTSGNLYGTTISGGSAGFGTLYKLTRQPAGSWTETVLYNFDGTSAADPSGTPTFGPNGNLYGTFFEGGLNGGCSFGTCGGVFEYSAGGIHTFPFDGADGGGPIEGVTLDSRSGILFGTTSFGPSESGNVFEIREGNVLVLHTFCSLANCADGSFPSGPLVEHGGKLYGVTSAGGSRARNGVVFEITPGLP